jgi:hypothetical protein
MHDSTQQHAARLKQLWKWATSPIDNPWIALGLAAVGGIGLLLLLWYLSPFLQQLPLPTP